MAESADHDYVDSISPILWETYFRQGQAALRSYNAPEAIRMFEIASQRSEAFGDHDHRHLETMRMVAMACLQAHDYDKAAKLLPDLLDKLSEKHGDHSVEVSDALQLLATALENLGRYHEAARLLQHAMAGCAAQGRKQNDPVYVAIKRRYAGVIEKTH